MPMTTNQRVVLSAATAEPSSFTVEQCPTPHEDDGIIVEIVMLGMNAGMRSRMGKDNPRGGHSGIPIGGVPNSDAIVRVVSSTDELFPEGALAMRQWSPWQRFSVCPSAELIDIPDEDPVVLATLLGHTGKTAWEALRIADLNASDHIVVSAAAGGVGTCLVQFARTMGAQVTGIASGDRCRVVRELGIECIDRSQGLKLPDFTVFHDAVGGALLETAIDAIADGGRIVICGALDGTPPANYARIIHHDVQLRGFSVINSPQREPFCSTVSRWYHEHKIHPVATVFDGLSAAGQAFCTSAPGRKLLRVS